MFLNFHRVITRTGSTDNLNNARLHECELYRKIELSIFQLFITSYILYLYIFYIIYQLVYF
jgi:hypothetical protein